MGDQLIGVWPLGGGWAVECDLTGQPLMFLAADRAEAQARRFAQLWANSGQDAQIVVHGDLSEIVRTYRYFGDEIASRTALFR